MLQKINYFATRACDVLLLPFASLPAFWGVLFLGVLTSLFVLVIYRWISSPAKVRETKDRIKANILAIRLYRDFWRVIVSSFFKSLYFTGKYFVLNLAPLLAVLPLLFLLFVQMDIRYGMRPFRPGESVTLKASFANGIDGREAGLRPGASLKPAMNPVYVDALGEIDWKLQAVAPGAPAVAITVGGVTVSKKVVVGDGLPALSNRKLAASSLAHFIYPAEKLLEAPAPIRAVSVQYPPRSISFLGIRTHWLVWYLIITFVLALALKNKFGVEF